MGLKELRNELASNNRVIFQLLEKNLSIKEEMEKKKCLK